MKDVLSLEELQQSALRAVELNTVDKIGIYTSNCDCGDNDGCDGDCGSDGSEGC
jgi:hypothetical protein